MAIISDMIFGDEDWVDWYHEDNDDEEVIAIFYNKDGEKTATKKSWALQGSGYLTRMKEEAPMF